MNTKKILVMALAMTAATCVFAHGPHGGWGHHHHHHHHGLGLAAGIVGLTAATVGLAHDIIAPAPAVYTTPAVYPAPVPAPVVAPAPIVAPAPVVVAPPPVVYPAPAAYPRVYRRYW